VTPWNQARGDERNTAVLASRGDFEGPQRPPSTAWTTEVRGSIDCPLVVDRDTVYVGTSEGELTALDFQGRRRWTYRIDVPTVDPPAVSGHRLVCPCRDHLLAIDAPSGDLEWERSVDGLYTTPPTVDGDLVLVGDNRGLTALHAETGGEIWRTDLEGPPVGAPAVDDERVYVGTREETVQALELGSGEEVWSAPTDGTVVGGPTRADDRVYVADDDGTVLALGAETGQTFFTHQIRGAFAGAPTVLEGEDTLYVRGVDDTLHVTDTTFGNRKVRGLLFSKPGLSLDAPATTDPIVVGTVVLVADERGGLYGIDALDPDFVWHTSLESAISGTPALEAQVTASGLQETGHAERGRLFLGDTAGAVSCLNWGE